MMPLGLHLGSGRSLCILCLGAHCDDIEIGCGGALLSLLSAYADVSVMWVVFSSGTERAAEARRSADSYLTAVERKRVSIESFPDGFFPYRGEEIKRGFEGLKREVAPDLIFTHHGEDSHQDHRLVHELTWNTFRDNTILQYEIPKYEGDLGRPNVYVPLDPAVCDHKIELLMRHYQTQQNKHWFTEETFRAVLRLRGIECRSPSGYAEAFHCPKLALQFKR